MSLFTCPLKLHSVSFIRVFHQRSTF